MRFANSRGTQKHNILLVLNEAERCQIINLRAIDGGLESKIEISKALMVRETSHPDGSQHRHLFFVVNFGITQKMQSLQHGQVTLLHAVQSFGKFLFEFWKFQVAEILNQRLVTDVYKRQVFVKCYINSVARELGNINISGVFSTINGIKQEYNISIKRP